MIVSRCIRGYAVIVATILLTRVEFVGRMAVGIVLHKLYTVFSMLVIIIQSQALKVRTLLIALFKEHRVLFFVPIDYVVSCFCGMCGFKDGVIIYPQTMILVECIFTAPVKHMGICCVFALPGLFQSECQREV